MNKRILAVAAALTLLASSAIAAAPAQAATPKPGAVCASSGQVLATSKFTMVCGADAAGKLSWGKQLPVSKINLTMADAWVKSIDIASSPWGAMTGAFGTFVNPTAKAVRVIAAYSSITPLMQMHEVVMTDGKMVMQQKKAGFTIPARGTKQMKPGADHTMFMSLTKNINPGDMVYVTYVTSTGARFTQPFLAKVYVGGNETYNPAPTTTN